MSASVDLPQFTEFLKAVQPELVETFDLGNSSPKRHQFLSRLQGEISKRGIIDVLRKGIQHQAHSVDLFYGTPSPDNAKAINGTDVTASLSLDSFDIARTRRRCH